ncbi:hypothetical protein BLNAU_20025 [Blattamonas nauphoetae]|uniref:Uncharacterized protein n=1 Tax=Blattamonas nauphoetae TaxID=2049346 RepID=A0ABQ9X255_9EUKA|nr:hypothetical protein BLNAU_20025 [Blattamonas nauphoetae]
MIGVAIVTHVVFPIIQYIISFIRRLMLQSSTVRHTQMQNHPSSASHTQTTTTLINPIFDRILIIISSIHILRKSFHNPQTLLLPIVVTYSIAISNPFPSTSSQNCSPFFHVPFTCRENARPIFEWLSRLSRTICSFRSQLKLSTLKDGDMLLLVRLNTILDEQLLIDSQKKIFPNRTPFQKLSSVLQINMEGVVCLINVVSVGYSFITFQISVLEISHYKHASLELTRSKMEIIGNTLPMRTARPTFESVPLSSFTSLYIPFEYLLLYSKQSKQLFVGFVIHVLIFELLNWTGMEDVLHNDVILSELFSYDFHHSSKGSISQPCSPVGLRHDPSNCQYDAFKLNPEAVRSIWTQHQSAYLFTKDIITCRADGMMMTNPPVQNHIPPCPHTLNNTISLFSHPHSDDVRM